MKRQRFINDLHELKRIIDFNKANKRKTGPIITGLYNRINNVFKIY